MTKRAENEGESVEASIVEYSRVVDSGRRRGDEIYRDVEGNEFNPWAHRGGRDVGISCE